MPIKCAFLGVARGAEIKQSRGGKDYLLITAEIDADPDNTQHVACFRGTEQLVDVIKPGSQIFVRGTVKLNTWLGKDGKERSALAITASDVEVILAKQGKRALDARAPKQLEGAVNHPAVKMAKAHFPDAKIESVTMKDGQKWTPGPVGTELNDDVSDVFAAYGVG